MDKTKPKSQSHSSDSEASISGEGEILKVRAERLREGQADPFQVANPAQRPKHVSCTISWFCSIFYWPSWALCSLFEKSCQKCFPVSIIWAMLKLCCYSKPSCSGNAPQRLVSSAGGEPTCNGLRCRDFSASSCSYSSACADITDQP